MPHKHTRKRNGGARDFDLGPTVTAKPLAAFEHPTVFTKKSNDAGDKSKKRKRNARNEDDTPRAFARLMQMQAGVKPRSGLDDGTSRKAKKRKVGQEAQSTADVPSKSITSDPTLRIQPGERLADFAARVDQALPMGGLTRKGNVKVEGIKERQTKTEKRLKKMYAEWREEDTRRKDAIEEFQEKQEELAEEKETEFGGQSLAFPEGRRKKRKRLLGETVASDDEDPWAVLNERREKPKGLHDVVQAPPTLKVVPKEKFKVRNGAKVNVANVPANAGSLKRREELGDARREVIERYRTMMKGKS